jgi:hypothetical protein
MKSLAGKDWMAMAVEMCGKVGGRLSNPRADKKSGSRAAALRTNSLLLAKNICVEEVVAELALGVEFIG